MLRAVGAVMNVLKPSGSHIVCSKQGLDNSSCLWFVGGDSSFESSRDFAWFIDQAYLSHGTLLCLFSHDKPFVLSYYFISCRKEQVLRTY